MSMVDESPRYYIENGSLYHYTPSNLYLSAGFYTGTDAIKENLGDIHKNKEKMRELIENGYGIYDFDKKKWVEIGDVEMIEKESQIQLIEKASEWLRNNYEKYYYLDEAYDQVISIKNLIKDFEKYMKGE